MPDIIEGRPQRLACFSTRRSPAELCLHWQPLRVLRLQSPCVTARCGCRLWRGHALQLLLLWRRAGRGGAGHPDGRLPPAAHRPLHGRRAVPESRHRHRAGMLPAASPCVVSTYHSCRGHWHVDVSTPRQQSSQRHHDLCGMCSLLADGAPTRHGRVTGISLGMVLCRDAIGGAACRWRAASCRAWLDLPGGAGLGDEDHKWLPPGVLHTRGPGERTPDVPTPCSPAGKEIMMLRRAACTCEASRVDR